MSATTPRDHFDSATSLSPDVIQAVVILQNYSLHATDTAVLDQLEHSLDELVRHPERTGDPKQMAYSARQNGRKFVYERMKIAPSAPYSEELDNRADNSYEEKRLISEISLFIDRSEFEMRDRAILHALTAGYEAKDIARAANVSLARAQVWVSRARKKARTAWIAIAS